ncbi:hypothetical protein VNI00_016020 [Paramarasmius palmivorus]|uniref:CxC2-like cysteine cluster KDZ transposase-associated domain-containing protein n=1 Tax=Paramarasmius palmivorus TaxID=297713 RepID=A0AAW0BHU2_9AGAR
MGKGPKRIVPKKTSILAQAALQSRETRSTTTYITTGAQSSAVHTRVEIEDPTRLKRPNSIPNEEGSQKKRQRKRDYTSQAASRFLQRFTEADTMNVLCKCVLAKEADPLTLQPCPCDVAGAKRTVRCMDCRFSAPTCPSCFINTHISSPFHWVESWNGQFFERRSITDLGHTITLGHNGGHCPAVDHSATKPTPFTVVDCNGLHKVTLIFCSCPHSGSRFEQLLLARIFPATVDVPETGFTFECLQDFHIQTLVSKKSAYDHLMSLRMKTDNAFPEKVSNPMQDFLRVSRIWRNLLANKRAGQWHDIDQGGKDGLSGSFPYRQSGRIVVPCMVCPEPGFNVSEAWDEADSEAVNNEFIHLATMFLSADGHFGLQRKDKFDDLDDVSMCEGQGIFPRTKWFTEFMERHQKNSKQKSNCASFRVMEMQNKLKFKGSVVTGVVAIQCARHGTFISAVDMSAGESFIHGDVAMYLAMQVHLINLLRRSRFFRRVVQIYDVACQFSIHFPKRIESYGWELGDVVEFIIFLVPKMHLDGHISDCKYRYSLNYEHGVGHTHGELIETSWGENKQVGRSTREMNHGHRHDVLTDFWNFWNWMKMVRMCPMLFKGLKNARAMMCKKLEYFTCLSTEAGEARVTAWSKLSTKAYVDPKTSKLKSVYRFDHDALPSQESMLHALLNGFVAREAAADAQITAPRAKFINQGLKIEQTQRELKALIAEATASPADVIKQRSSLRAQIRKWREQQQKFMPAVSALVEALRTAATLETEELYLPSSFPSDSQYADSGLCLIETKLWRGQAYDAIRDLKHVLRHSDALSRHKRKYSRGVTMNLRSTKFICEVSSKKNDWIQKYAQARICLIRLGNTSGEADSEFPELQDQDMIRPNVGMDAALGEGSKTVGWIWTKEILAATSLQGSDVEQLDSVPWFRTRADLHRWIEEIELLEEEFRRLVRASEKMCETWRRLGSSGPDVAHRAYAFQKASMFSNMANEARTKLEEAGGGWPGEGESLTDYLRKRRPQVGINVEPSELSSSESERDW